MGIMNAFRRISILGEIVAYYVGALFLYEFWSLSYGSDVTLGFDILRFDPYLVAVSIFIVIAGRGIIALRTHPATRNHILPGAFKRNEVVVIESLAIFGVTAWYAFIEYGGYIHLDGGGLYSSLLGGALSAMFEITIVFYVLRWLYIVSESWADSDQLTGKS